MTIAIPQLASNVTFGYWANVTNLIANALSTSVVSVNSNNAVGNAAITGMFTANTITTSNLQLTNSTGYPVINVVAPASPALSNTQYFLNANGQWSLPQIYTVNITTSGTSAQVIDSFLMSTFNSSKYIVSVIDNVSNNFYSSELLIMHDTANPYITEYASLTSNSNVGNFTASTNSTSVILSFTPVSTSTTVKISKVTI